jgi:hypothetical protein
VETNSTTWESHLPINKSSRKSSVDPVQKLTETAIYSKNINHHTNRGKFLRPYTSHKEMFYFAEGKGNSKAMQSQTPCSTWRRCCYLDPLVIASHCRYQLSRWSSQVYWERSFFSTDVRGP